MSLFGTDGIRGRAGEGPLAPENVVRLGAAIGRVLKNSGTVLIGRDTRPSGPQIEEALIRGLGVRVLRAGVLPTPGVAVLARAWKCALGIVISASHNPPEDNGIKLIGGDGFKVPDRAEAAVERWYARGPSGRRAVVEDVDPGAYVKRLRTLVRLRGVKIVLDCANGATSQFAPRLFKDAGARVVVINASSDGNLINRNCGAIHPEGLAERVRQEGAALGVAFDGDGDRAMFVDETGTRRDGDDFLFLAAPKMRAKTIVGTSMTNYGLELALKEKKIKLRRAAVGDRYVVEEMRRCGANLGGEPSGHIISFRHSTTGDGMLTALLLLKFGATFGGWTRLPQLIVNVRVREKTPLEGIAPVAKAIADVGRTLKGRGRLVVRYSGTEPLCRIMVEGPDADEVKRLARQIGEPLEQHLGDQAVRQH